MTIRHVLPVGSPAGRLVASLRRPAAAVQYEPNASLFGTSFHPQLLPDLPFEPMPPKARAPGSARSSPPPPPPAATCYRCGKPGRVVPMTGDHWLDPRGDELISLTATSNGAGPPGDVHPSCEVPGAVHPPLDRAVHPACGGFR